MCSSASPSSLFLPINTRFLWRRCDVTIISSPKASLNHRRFRNPRVRFSASVAERNLQVVSWSHSDADNDYGGWAIVEAPVQKNKKSLPSFLFAGVGTSIAVLVAAIAHFSLSRKGFKFQFSSPLHALHGMVMPAERKADQSKTTDSDASDGAAMVTEASPEYKSDAVSEIVGSASVAKLERVIIPVAVDSTQQEALLVLKKLKVYRSLKMMSRQMNCALGGNMQDG